MGLLTSQYPPARIVHGDSSKMMTLEYRSADLIITSPPYNVGMSYSGEVSDDLLDDGAYERFSRRWLTNCIYWAKPNARLCVNVALDTSKPGKFPIAAKLTEWAMAAGWKYHATIIWNEGNISNRTAWGSWKSASAPHIIAPVEVILVFYIGEWKRPDPGESTITAEEFKDWTLGLWSFNGESAKRIGHEAPFPIELPKRLIKLFSFKEDTILDPFLGSGTTAVAALANMRSCIGIEIEEKYCQLARQRLDQSI